MGVVAEPGGVSGDQAIAGAATQRARSRCVPDGIRTADRGADAQPHGAADAQSDGAAASGAASSAARPTEHHRHSDADGLTGEGRGELLEGDVALKLDRVFLGTGIDAGDTITIQELPNVDLSLTPDGSQGFFFLSWDKDTSSHLIINPEGRFLADGSGNITSSETDPDDWVLAIEKETPQQFTQDVVSAVDSVRLGSATATPVA